MKSLGQSRRLGSIPPPSRRMVGAPTPTHLTSSFRPLPTSICPSNTTSPGPRPLDGMVAGEAGGSLALALGIGPVEPGSLETVGDAGGADAEHAPPASRNAIAATTGHVRARMEPPSRDWVSELKGHV